MIIECSNEEENSKFIKRLSFYLLDHTENLPPIDEFKLLSYEIESLEIIDELLIYYENLFNKSFKIMEKFFNKILILNWCGHKNIRLRYEIIIDEKYCYSYIFSWINICRLITIKYHKIDNLNYLLDFTLHEFQFIKKIKEKIIITNDKIKDFSIRSIWQSIVLLWPCLYKYPYSDEMRKYFNILFYYYSLILTYKNENFNDIDYPRYYRLNHNNNRDNTNNNFSILDEYSNQIEYNDLDLNIDENKIIKSCLIFDAEIIFYHQLTRFTILKSLLNNYSKHKLTYYYKDNPYSDNNNNRFMKMINLYQKSILILIEDQFLKSSIWENLKNNFSTLYLMHGEIERYYRENLYLSRKPHPDDILNKIRQNDYQKINKLKEKTNKDFINDYINELKIHLKDPLIFFDFKNEKESLFLTYTALEKYILLSHIKNLDLNKIFLCEYFTDLSKFEKLIDNLNNNNNNKNDIPIFLFIMKHSFVIDLKRKSIFHSMYFIESFIIWIVLLSKYNHINIIKNKELINLQPFIDFIEFNRNGI